MIRRRRLPLRYRKPSSYREKRPALRVNGVNPVYCLLCNHAEACVSCDNGTYQCPTCKRHWRVQDQGTSRTYVCVPPASV